ncbi:MAG: RNA polymerase subunit sigma-70, partial [Desulfobulbaceae bacterium]|nr:RNA polymerase subunit sigma-70 [Desulfobulbaceae bacterium]
MTRPSDPDIIDISENGEVVADMHPLVSMPDSKHLPANTLPGLQRYLHEINQYALLSREEAEELARRFHETGDQQAAYQLVTANLRL